MANDKERAKPMSSGRKRIDFSYDEVPQPKGEFKDLFKEMQQKVNEAKNQRPTNEKKGDPPK